ncbi:hypothetical protein [Kiritimatiella glycovorans]|uniref:Uncharacterized protein n=1 Tax=Kiritimatiella glycovorans TaxID=1307763 RepID=A0A0G3ED67_9BACT|nr:hypothetical protein [Kiritimatiella glycovorans]AKJ64421.1 hypothetical protein L21SP4_01172 [Kiritimatiella glycovorans]
MHRKRMLSATSLALILVAGISSAQDVVVSENIVGFVRENTEPGVQIVGVPFVNGTNTLAEIVGTNGVAGNDISNADVVYAYTPEATSYKEFWLADDSYGAEFQRKWIDHDQSIVATNEFTSEAALWYKSRAATSNELVFVGEVVADGAVTNTIVPGVQLVSYPFSCDQSLNEMSLTNGLAGEDISTADTIYLYVPGEGGYKSFWLADDSYGAEFQLKWIDRDKAEVATNVVGMGQGFWYRSRGASAFDWVEERPYDLQAE